MPAQNLSDRRSLIDELEKHIDFVTRLERFEKKIDLLIERLVDKPAEKDFHTTAEVAAAVRRTEYTVREWCRKQRIQAVKRACGRGKSKEWMVSKVELSRVLSEGLLPETGTNGYDQN